MHPKRNTKWLNMTRSNARVVTNDQRNPTIDQNYCSVPLAYIFWYDKVKIVKMIKMAGLQGHSLKGVINAFRWWAIMGHMFNEFRSNSTWMMT